MEQHRGGRIRNRLVTCRQQVGFSQKEAARLLGHQTNGQLSRWENGASIPSLENLMRLSFLYRRLINDLYLDLFWEIGDEMIMRVRDYFHQARCSAPNTETSRAPNTISPASPENSTT